MLDKVLNFARESMFMSDDVWLRHANPWSGWTRVLTYPLFILAFWSRDWLGIWFLIPVAAVFAWTWINPRVFSKPTSTDNWLSKGVFGEKIFTERKKKQIQVAQHHITSANVLTTVQIIGLAILIYGLVVLDIWPTLLGAAVAFLGKMWFVDRMVWLYEDMKHILNTKTGNIEERS